MKGMIITLLVATCAIALVAAGLPKIPGADMVPGVDMAQEMANTGMDTGLDATKSIPGGDVAGGFANQAPGMTGRKRRSMEPGFEGNFEDTYSSFKGGKGKKGKC